MSDITEYGELMINAYIDEWGNRKIDGVLEDGVRIIITGVAPIVKTWTALLNATHSFTRPSRFIKFSQTVQTLHQYTVSFGLILKQWTANLVATHTFRRPTRSIKFTQSLQAVHSFTLKRLLKFIQTVNVLHFFRRPQRKIGYTETLHVSHTFSRPIRIIKFSNILQVTHLFSRPSRLIKWLQSLGVAHEYYVIKPGVEPMKIILLLGNIAIDLKTGKVGFIVT